MIEGTTYYAIEDIRSNIRRALVYAAKGEKVKLISFNDHMAIVEHEKTGRFSVHVAKLSKEPVERDEVKAEPRVTFKQFREAMKPGQPKQKELF